MKKILLAAPAMHREELQYIQKAFETNWIAPLGSNVDEFEDKVAAYVGTPSDIKNIKEDMERQFGYCMDGQRAVLPFIVIAEAFSLSFIIRI